jgi:Fe-S-cluster containining protein
LNSWHHISKEWSDESFLSLVERCLRKYLFPNNDKGCVFIDKQNNICLQHETRPFNCRIYGITPEEEFTPRYERLKVIYPDARNQCNLVSTVNGKKVTTHDTEKWWNEINAVEMSIGIKKETINDSPGGSYRTYHDHILIHLLGDSGMEYLGNLRSNGSNNEKEHTIRRVLNSLKKFKESQKNDKLSSKNESTETSKNNRE